MFQYPYGDSQQLNLDWLMEQWLETKASIDGSLQGEIDRVEAAITDLLTARDQAVAAKTAAETAATSASGYASTASTAASTATAQATAAAGSAALAGTHASNAQTSETNAGLQATAAGNSAAAAAVSAGNASNSEGAAAASSSAAAGNALYAEGMAKGTQNGTPVTSGSPYYEDNAAYWAGEAQSHASNAIAASYYSEAMAKGTVNGTPVASGDPGYEDNAEYYKDQAAAQAAAAAASAASADGTNAQKMIAAPEEATSTAAAAHAAGTYFRYNSKLYKATQDIPLGGTITPNTNCVEDTVCAELTAQSEQIDDIVSIDKSLNLLNPANITVGYYYGYKANQDGSYSPDLKEGSDYACAYVDVVNGNKYTVSKTSYNSYNVNADGKITGYASQSQTMPCTLNTSGRSGGWGSIGDTVRIYFSWKLANMPTSAYMCVLGETLPQEYTPFGDSISLKPDVNVDINQVKTKEYVVDVNGGGDYTSLMDAFVDLSEDESEKIIYIKSGTYDIFEEIGGSDFVDSIPSSGASYWDYITLVPKNTKVIGIGGVTLQYLPESVPEVAAEFISPINISDGNTWLENVKIVCKNCRYAIHDQTRDDHPEGYTHVYKNVIAIKDDSNGITGLAQSLGGGLTKGANIIVDSCIFKSYRVAFSYHNSSNAYASIWIKNSAFYNFIATRGVYPSIRFNNVSGNQVHIPVNISNSYMNDGIKIGNETETERPNAYDIVSVNNTGNANITITTETNIYTPTVFPEIT